MALKDIVPWRKQAPAHAGDYFQSFREQLDKLFNEFWSDFPGMQAAARSERAYGSFQRVLTLPARVNAEKVNATFRDGVLTVKLAKIPESEAGSRQIRISR